MKKIICLLILCFGLSSCGIYTTSGYVYTRDVYNPYHTTVVIPGYHYYKPTPYRYHKHHHYNHHKPHHPHKPHPHNHHKPHHHNTYKRR